MKRPTKAQQQREQDLKLIGQDPSIGPFVKCLLCLPAFASELKKRAALIRQRNEAHDNNE